MTSPRSIKYALDTVVAIEVLRGNKEVETFLESLTTSYLVPSIVAGELYGGAAASKKREQNVAEIEFFLKNIVILDCDLGTARIYGRLFGAVHRIGKAMPTNDLWIAALCIQHELTLITRDAHFEHVAELKHTSWLNP